MDARTVGLRLVELTTAGQDATALDELYADSVVSVEVMSDPVAEPQRWEGIRAVREKHEWWENVATVHQVDVEGPFAGNGDDHFVVRLAMDVTLDGQRNQMAEVGLFTVADGKIVKEVYLGLVGTSRQNEESEGKVSRLLGDGHGCYACICCSKISLLPSRIAHVRSGPAHPEFRTCESRLSGGLQSAGLHHGENRTAL